MTTTPDIITCERCGRTTTDPDLWDPEAGTGRIFCNRCWDHRDEPASTKVAIVLVVDIPNIPGRDPMAVAEQIALGSTELHDATIAGHAVHGDPDVGWAAITPSTDGW